ncbi:MAG: hypothetical protein AB1439_03740 [candidate division FCPU426 bacterium]
MDFFSRLRRTLAPLGLHFCGTPAPKTSAVLRPEERAAVSAAVPARVREYATGRWCARRALSALGIAPRPLPSRATGAPAWPAGTCGSIAHAAQAACAVAAGTRRYRSLGIDLESRARRLSPGSLALIANEDELAWLHFFSAPGRVSPLFLAGAKESAFKLLSPLVGRRFSFPALSLLPPVTADHFEFVLNEDLGRDFPRGRRFQGKWFGSADWVVSLCWLYCEDHAGRRRKVRKPQTKPPKPRTRE